MSDRPTSQTAPVHDVERVVSACVARRLGKSGALDPTVPLTCLGLDSLGSVEFTASLENALGVHLSPDALDPEISVRSLDLMIRSRRAAQPCAEAERVERMRADAVLPDDVRPAVTGVQSLDRIGLLSARAILMTGATGFLGGRIAADVLRQSNARLVCLVRGRDDEAQYRLRHCLATHGIDADTFAARVRVLDGDLSRPALGIHPAEIDAAASDLDAILHIGASVNWVQPYAALRRANVLGTLELLRIACRRGLDFHFVSSLSVCYATPGPVEADERHDPMPYLAGLHLGYAQTKAVAESLVREAGRRGLSVRIYRPSLISGDSLTGAFNADDLLSLVIRGCIHMGAAPDLDWTVDAVPVDAISRDILALSAERGELFHLVQRRPRHWRECVFWMRVKGYPLRLVPYSAWLRALERETSLEHPHCQSHPLRRLRSFFLRRRAAAGGLSLPELMEDGRRTKAVATVTAPASGSLASSRTPLDAQLLDRYFRAFIASGHLPNPPPQPSNRRRGSRTFEGLLAEALDRVLGPEPARRVELIESGSDHSIIGELTAWRFNRPAALRHYRIHTPSRGVPLDVVVKIKSRDRDVIAIGESLAYLCDEQLGAAYSRWQDSLGLLGSHLREESIYRMNDVRIRARVPKLLDSTSIGVTGERVLVLERIGSAVLMDSVSAVPVWPRRYVARAIRDLAALHSVWYGRAHRLQDAPWIGFTASASSALGMTDLWTALARHSARMFSRAAGGDMPSIQRQLVATVGKWWPWLDESPRTLIHHDFNPRNICFRSGPEGLRLCAYDWELATLGAPQRDLAELLCFVLPASVSASEIHWWVELHRRALARAADTPIDGENWRRGFQAALYDLAIDRLAMYTLIHRVRHQPFLDRVMRTWRRIYECFPLPAKGR